MKKALILGGGIIGAYLIFKAMKKRKDDKATESMRDFATRPVDMRKPVLRPPNMPIEQRTGAVPIAMIKPIGMTRDMYEAQLK